ncbi:DUF6723 family protein [Caballeronia sp. LZ043]|uniref:DUF6723 family protein n=1 Tax=Caballeronia sp. LZ043 TaxID=3038569 RepID=UPI002865F71C|nr:DUF6723 family protein [Caballeronia sp. LZ043]MDR5822499.1 hypothetical protein [Caballeronia sp. LZ043]
MRQTFGKRPKLVLFSTSTTPCAGSSPDDFLIYASYRGSQTSGYVGTLKVVRKTDSRLLYPFEGAEQLGPFKTMIEAIEAAQARGEAIVNGDIANPEL